MTLVCLLHKICRSLQPNKLIPHLIHSPEDSKNIMNTFGTCVESLKSTDYTDQIPVEM